MLILLHTSKTMHKLGDDFATTQKPALLPKATELASYLQSLSTAQLATAMKVSPKLAENVHDQYARWTRAATDQRTAIDSFAGDIYSGLQVPTWTSDDRTYAQAHLRILSGLYGILRPLDGVMPYRLEMGYRLPSQNYKNLYTFWGDTIVKTLPANEKLINLAAAEYSKTVLPYIPPDNVITPTFLTISPKTKQPTFVVVHAKIARGAFAAWLIKHRIDAVKRLPEFSELNYGYSRELSQPNAPVYICQQFGGLGLSVRLQHS